MWRRLIKWLLGLIGIPLIAVLAINAFDEDLTPEIAELLKPMASGVPDKDNAYYVLIGLDAPSGVAPYAFGRQWVEKMMAADQRAQEMTRADKLKKAEQAMDVEQVARESLRKQPGPVKSEDRKYLCRRAWPQEIPCLERVKRNKGEVRRVLDENRELLDRYRLLFKYPTVVEAFVPRDSFGYLDGSPHLFGSPYLLWITHVALEFDNGNLETAFADLGSDMTLRRALLRGSRQLMTKSVALTLLETDISLLAEMVVAKPAAARQFNEQIDTMLVPLTADELSWKPLEKGEFTLGRSIFVQDPDSPSEWLLEPFFKRNATVNRLYAAWKTVYEWNEFSADQDEAMRQRVAQANRRLQFPYWTFAYNPVGKWYLSNNDFDDLIPHFERCYDFEGLRRLVALAALIARVGRDNIPGLIEKSDKRLSDPYTGKPMKWDADRKQIYFEPRSNLWLSQKQPIGGVPGRIGVNVLP